MTEPIKWSDAPDRTSWGASMRVADIALDRDHTLTLYCEASQTAKVDAMFAEAERLRADAERYRFVRDAGRSAVIERELRLYAMESLDEYVDAAIEAEAALKETK